MSVFGLQNQYSAFSLLFSVNMSTVDLGKHGEDLACDFLQKKSFKILTRNFSCKLGEIDIIGIDQRTLVFVEVKTRWNDLYGKPEEAITPSKIRTIVKVSQYFKLLNPQTPDLMRLDAVVIEMNSEGDCKRIEQIKNLTS